MHQYALHCFLQVARLKQPRITNPVRGVFPNPGGTPTDSIELDLNGIGDKLYMEWSVFTGLYYNCCVVFKDNIPVAVIPREGDAPFMTFQYTLVGFDNTTRHHYMVSAAIGDSVIQPEHGAIIFSRSIYYPAQVGGVGGPGTDFETDDPTKPVIP